MASTSALLKDEIGFFEGMVVEGDAGAGEVLEEQHAVVAGSELFIDHPLEEDIVGSGEGSAGFGGIRDLGNVEVTQ